MKRRLIFSAMTWCVFALPALAHGDEKHGAKPAAVPGAIVVNGPGIYLPKESQFLFKITTQRVSATSLAEAIPFSAMIVARPDGKATLTAPAAGQVISAGRGFPKIGDRVAKGQALLAFLGSLSGAERLQAGGDLQRSGADVVEAESELDLARRGHARMIELQKIVSTRELEASAARVANAEARLRAARQVRGGLASSLDSRGGAGGRLILRSPINGVITAADYTLNEQVEAGHALLTVLDASTLYAEAQVPEAELSRVRGAANTGAVVVVNSLPGHSYPAKLLAVSQALDPATRSAKAVFEVPNPEGDLAEGMQAVINAQSGKTVTGFIVPPGAVTEVDGRQYIFVKTAPEIFLPREVRLGLQNPDATEIREGLEDGDLVAVSGAFQLRAAFLSAK